MIIVFHWEKVNLRCVLPELAHPLGAVFAHTLMPWTLWQLVSKDGVFDLFVRVQCWKLDGRSSCSFWFMVACWRSSCWRRISRDWDCFELLCCWNCCWDSCWLRKAISCCCCCCCWLMCCFCSCSACWDCWNCCCWKVCFCMNLSAKLEGLAWPTVLSSTTQSSAFLRRLANNSPPVTM